MLYYPTHALPGRITIGNHSGIPLGQHNRLRLRIPVYYGWVIIFFGTLMMLCSIPGQTMGVSVFTDRLILDLGLHRDQLSLTYLGGTLLSGLLLPRAGALLDRIGVQPMSLLAFGGLALSLLLMLGSTRMAAWSVFTGRPWLTGALAFFFFFGIRHFGQGQLVLIARTCMGRWFDRRRGLALGLSGAFVSLGFGSAPLVLHQLLQVFGFAGTLTGLAAILVLLAVPAWFILRDSPEACGVPMEGRSGPDAAMSAETSLTGITLQAARRQPVFWALVLTFCSHSLLITGLTFHLAAIGAAQQVEAATAFSIFLPAAFCSVLSNLAGGYASDRISLRWLLLLLAGGLLLTMYGLQYLDQPVWRHITAIAMGCAGGLFACLSSVAMPRLFGRRYLGSINGFTTAGMVLASAPAPWLFALLAGPAAWDRALSAMMLLPLLILAFTLVVRFPPGNGSPAS